MKSSKVCPKCSSEDIAVIRNYLMKDWGTAEVERWVCRFCGYSEMWTPESELEKIKNLDNSG